MAISFVSAHVVMDALADPITLAMLHRLLPSVESTDSWMMALTRCVNAYREPVAPFNRKNLDSYDTKVRMEAQVIAMLVNLMMYRYCVWRPAKDFGLKGEKVLWVGGRSGLPKFISGRPSPLMKEAMRVLAFSRSLKFRRQIAVSVQDHWLFVNPPPPPEQKA